MKLFRLVDGKTARRKVVALVAALVGLHSAAPAAEFYAAPNGTASGNGSISSPWDLQTALNHPATVRPGDTIWMRGGKYVGVFNSRLVGTAAAPIIVRQYPGERATISDPVTANHLAALTLGSSSYTWYWGFEVTSAPKQRVSTTAGNRNSAGFPTPSGVDTQNSGTGVRLINLQIHDVLLEGIGSWLGSTDIDIYGCLVFYNGWIGPIQGYEHGIYTQNDGGYKKIRDCFIYYNAESGLQAYGSAGPVNNYTVTGNCAFNNGALHSSWRGGRNFLVGGATQAQNPVVTDNCMFRDPNTGGGTSDFYIGYGGGAKNALIRSNQVVCNALFSTLTSSTVDYNKFYGSVVGLSTSTYPNNTYLSRPTTGTMVVVRPNEYEAGRANVMIYNWALQNTVSVDVSKVLSPGDTYELRNTMDYYGDIVTGTYSGSPISVAMTGRKVAAPVLLNAPPSPFPAFGAFVLMKTGTGAPVNTPPTISNIGNQTTTTGTATAPLAFTVGDAQTAAGSLTVTASSSNTTLVPASGLLLGGSGANRTVTVTPAAGQTGSATITVTVSDGTARTSTSFTLTVNAPPNTAPTISSINSQTIVTGSSTGPIPFTVGDAQTAAGSLNVTAASSNSTLVPASGIVLGGSGSSRTVSVTPAAGQTGTATITLAVSDGSLTANTSFTVTVNAPPNTAPTISSIANRTATAGTSTGPIPFTVGDAETAAASLAVTASSSNTALVPSSGLSLGGSGASRTIAVTPATGQTGTATITVRVSDGSLTASTVFTVTVNAPSGGGGNNTAPTISAIADQVVTAGGSSGQIAFTVGDVETAAGSLTVTAKASNPDICPTGSIVIGGSGSSRTINVTPATREPVTTSLLVTVSDGTACTSTSFGLTVTPEAGLVYIGIEAEDGNVAAPMQVSANAEASGGKAVSTPNANAGSVTFNVAIPADGTYVIWARNLSANYSADSFIITVDGAGADVYDCAENIWAPNFQWTQVNGRNGGAVLSLNPRTFTLKKGVHAITFQGRDPNTILDRILITNDRQIGIWDN